MDKMITKMRLLRSRTHNAFIFSTNLRLLAKSLDDLGRGQMFVVESL